MTEDSPEKKKSAKPSLTLVEKASLENLLEKLNQQYAIIQFGSQVLIMRHWIGEDGQSKIIFTRKADFLIWTENQLYFPSEGKPPINIGKAWLTWSHRQSYEEVYFEPCGKEYPNRYNLWRDFAFKPQNNIAKCKLFLDHTYNNICQGDKEKYDWLLNWLADLFQNPTSKSGTAVVMRGDMGVGKGTFAHHVGALLGLHYMSVTQPGQLTGRFNHHMMDKLLVFVDEGWWSDDRKDAGTLNALVTEQKLSVEMKGKDIIYIDNYTRFIMAANADRVVQTGLSGERRYAFYDIGNAAQQNKPYFAAIKEQLEGGGYEALLYHLLHLPCDRNLARTIPQTEALQDHRLYSMPTEMTWWHTCLINEKIGDYKLHNTPDNDIETGKFYSHYIEHCKQMNSKPIPLNILPKKLKPFLHLNKQQMGTSTGRDYFYCLKALGDMRKDFEAVLGHEFDWSAG